MNHPLYEIVTTTAGAISIRNKAVNEIMHNPVGPWAEANALYVEQSRLAERLGAPGEELVLFDVGLGAAANALAALACARRIGPARPLRIVSFERDLDLLAFALHHADRFPHFAGWETAVAALLEHNSWTGNRIIWELRRGDFLDVIGRESTRPHLVFYDPYSPKVNQDMWTTACFAKLRARARTDADGGTVLFTYSQATRIRVALLRAGFHVGYGVPTGLKEETTQAATARELLHDPLGKVWFDRWRRSHLRHPFDCSPAEERDVDAFVEDYLRRFA